MDNRSSTEFVGDDVDIKKLFDAKPTYRHAANKENYQIDSASRYRYYFERIKKIFFSFFLVIDFDIDYISFTVVKHSIVFFLGRKSNDKMADGNNKVPENSVTGGQFKKPPVAPPADKGRQSLREQDQLPVGYLDAFG